MVSRSQKRMADFFMLKPKHIFTFLLLFAFFACSTYDDYVYEITGITAHNANNAGLEPVDVSDTVNAKAYCIRLHVTGQEISVATEGQDVHESGVINNDKLSDFKITSLTYFDASVDSGTVMNHYFLFSRNNIYNSSNLVSKNMALGGGIDVRTKKYETDNYLFLMHEPLNPGTCKFAITAYYQNGKIFTDTVSIYLK